MALTAKNFLWILITAYAVYFSSLTIQRYQNLHASYFDLGIMHQTVHNTYRAITTGDWSLFLEMTKPGSAMQFKRPAVHTDFLLVFLAPFYIFYDGPETLLVIQALVVALGAWAVFKITEIVFNGSKHKSWLALIFSAAYLAYPPMQHGTAFEMHAFTLVTPILLAAFYFALVRKFWPSLLFISLAILSKENVGLSVSLLGLYWIFMGMRGRDRALARFGTAVAIASFVWFALSVFVITPYFRGRGEQHFATMFYSEFGNTPGRIISGTLTSPGKVTEKLAQASTGEYIFQLLGPVGFLSLASPLQLIPALPELAINLLSSNSKMRGVERHYTALIQFFIFISAIYGAKRISLIIKTDFHKNNSEIRVIVWLMAAVLAFGFFKGLLPLSRNPLPKIWSVPSSAKEEAFQWKNKLKDENLKITSTNNLAPLFSGRKYFYNLSDTYQLADYAVINMEEIGPLIPAIARERLRADKNFILVHKTPALEVYKKLKDN